MLHISISKSVFTLPATSQASRSNKRRFYRARDAMLARYIQSSVYTVICPSVCLSVCHKSEPYTKKVKPRIAQTTLYDSPGTLVFRCQESRRNFNGSSPTGAPNRGGVG